MLWFNVFNGPDLINDPHTHVQSLDNIEWSEGHVYLMYDTSENSANNNGQLYVDVADHRRIKIGDDGTTSATIINPGSGGNQSGDIFSGKQFQGVPLAANSIEYNNNILPNFTYSNLQNAIFYIPNIVNDQGIVVDKFLPVLSAKSKTGIWSFGPSQNNTFAFYYADSESVDAQDRKKTAIYFCPDGSILAQQIYANIGNDYAEYRTVTDEVIAGQCVIEQGDGTLQLSTRRLQPGANIISDTFGSAIGKDKHKKQPLAVAGRVLAYPYEAPTSYQAGDPVCSGPNGTISRMSREEVQKYPDRIIGTVSEIPTYKIWEDNVNVNGRIWIKL